jgi:hypothetical protein
MNKQELAALITVAKKLNHFKNHTLTSTLRNIHIVLLNIMEEELDHNGKCRDSSTILLEAQHYPWQKLMRYWEYEYELPF